MFCRSSPRIARSRARGSWASGSAPQELFTDSLLRAGTYPGGPKPPFTPGYEIVGDVEEVGPGCSMVRPGDRVAVLMVWGGDPDYVCVAESLAVEVPQDIDPAALVSVIFPDMTAYQLLRRRRARSAG